MIAAGFSNDVSAFDKYFPPEFLLETSRVLLSPMQKEDLSNFLPITQSDFLWKYFTKELNDEAQLYQWMNEAIEERAAGKRVPLPFVIK